MQDCKQPRLDLAAIPQLVAFGRPDIECLLGKIARVGLRACQAETGMMEEILVLSRLDAGELDFRPSELDFLRTLTTGWGSRFPRAIAVQMNDHLPSIWFQNHSLQIF